MYTATVRLRGNPGALNQILSKVLIWITSLALLPENSPSPSPSTGDILVLDNISMVMTSPCALDVSWLLVHPNPASSAG